MHPEPLVYLFNILGLAGILAGSAGFSIFWACFPAVRCSIMALAIIETLVLKFPIKTLSKNYQNPVDQKLGPLYIARLLDGWQSSSLETQPSQAEEY